MTAINHGLTGVAIGVVFQSPIALPLAFFSHFVLDSIPHFGLPKRNKVFLVYLFLDASATALLLLWTIFISNQALLLSSCILLATGPDLVWAYRWFRELKYNQPFGAFKDPLTKFHAKIQWFEKPIGIIFELVWGAVMLVIISRKLYS